MHVFGRVLLSFLTVICFSRKISKMYDNVCLLERDMQSSTSKTSHCVRGWMQPVGLFSDYVHVPYIQASKFYAI
jgi:hypothetical protein